VSSDESFCGIELAVRLIIHIFYTVGQKNNQTG
jgi:hypothetical protein